MSSSPATSTEEAPSAGDAKPETLLQRVPISKQTALTFRDISLFVPLLAGIQATGPAKPAPAAKSVDVEQGKDDAAPKERQVLFQINGTVTPGEMLALMGPSGSGAPAHPPCGASWGERHGSRRSSPS